MNDIRQTKYWAKYLSQIGWDYQWVKGRLVLIRKVPFLNFSVIKVQHPKNPIPFAEIDQIAKSNKALCVIVEPEARGFDQTWAKTNGYNPSSMFLTHTATIQINLNQSEKKLWSSFSENARRNIKKAQNNNLRLKKIPIADDKKQRAFQTFYSLLKNLTSMKSFWAPDYNELQKKMTSFGKNSTLFFAYHQNKAVASVWVSSFGKQATYMHTGITKEGYRLLANYLLVWEGLKSLKKKGLKLFDFEGIYDPRFPKEKRSWINLTEFKKRFHGNLIEYPQPYIKCYNIFFKFIYLCSKILSKS